MSVKSIRSACGRSRYLPSLGCLLAIVAGSFAPAAAQAPSNFVSWLQSLPPDAQSLPLRRFRYFYEQRAYPNQTIPPGAMAQARQEHEQRFGPLRQQQAPGAAFNQTQWTSIGPKVIAASQLDPRNFPASGRISAIAIDPTTNVNNTNTIFIGGAAGGVWKTEDGGTTWRALTDTQCSLAMGSIAIDPSNNQVIYAGTGELNFGGDNYYGCGLLKSTDGGVTWTQMGGSVFAPSNQAGAKISKVAITGNTLMVASDFGLFRSTDGGSSFTPTPVLGSVGNPVTDLVIDVSNAMIMYAAIGNIFGGPGNGVYKSIDGGASFSPLSPPLSHGFPTTNVGRIALAIAPSASGTVYAAVQRTAPTFGTLLGIWKTTDSGGRWDKLAATGANCGGDDANGRGGQCWYDMYVAVDPTNANTVYFGGFSLYKSTDGGQTFPTDIGSTIHVDQHALAFKPGDANTIYAGNDGGLYVSSNGGGAFASLNDGLVITQFYPGLALNGSPPAVALGGTQDNGTIFTSVANGQSPWFLALGGDGGFAAIDGSTQPRTGYGETQWVANSGYSGPRKSSNIGTNAFVLATTGITLSDRAQFIPPLVMSPSTSSTLYFGTNVVYKTANSAGMWNSISPDLTNGGCCISTIAEAKSNGKVVYVGTGNGLLWMTPDGGTTWNLITGLPNRAITDIAVNPTNENNVFVTVSGFGNPGADGHVFMSINNGAKWTDISGTMPSRLPNIPVNAIVLDPSAPTTEILVGTDLGVYRTHDGGTTWTPFNAGLPNAPVLDLVYDSATKILAAATHGRGVWTAQMGAVRVTHDFNGDRLSDVLWYNTTNGLTVAWLVRCTTGGANPGCMSLSAPYDAADRADAAASPRAASSPATRACRSPG